jgi:hypothetical protein
MNSEFKKRFPKIAKRFETCREALGIDKKEVYGYFFNFCLNAARPGVGIKRVHCRPHVDWKNLAIGICVLFIYGEQSMIISFEFLSCQLIFEFCPRPL